MLTILRASAAINPSAILCPEEREDEPTIGELVFDALVVAGLIPRRDFRVEPTDGFALRISLLVPGILDTAVAALAGFDRASAGVNALLVAFSGDLDQTAVAA